MSGFSSWALPRCIRLQLLLMNFCSLASAFSFATVHPARYGSLNKARLGANSGFHGVSFPGKCGNNLRACTQVASRQSEALFGLINTKADRRVSASRATRTSTNIPLNVVKTSPRYKTQTPDTRGEMKQNFGEAARKAAGAARVAPAPSFESKDGNGAPLESQETATIRPKLLGSRHLAKIFRRKAHSAEPDQQVDSESISPQEGPNKALHGLVSRLGKPSIVADDAPLRRGHKLPASLQAFLETHSVGRAADANMEEDKHGLGGHLNLGQAVGLDEGAKAETMPVVLSTDPTDSMDWLGTGVMSAATQAMRDHSKLDKVDKVVLAAAVIGSYGALAIRAFIFRCLQVLDVSAQAVGQVKANVGAQLSLWRRASFPAYPSGTRGARRPNARLLYNSLTDEDREEFRLRIAQARLEKEAEDLGSRAVPDIYQTDPTNPTKPLWIRVAMARRRWQLEEAEMLRQEAENRQYRQDWLSHELLRSHVTVPLPERSAPKLKSLEEDWLRAGLYVPLFWSTIATEAVLTLPDCIKEASCWITSL